MYKMVVLGIKHQVDRKIGIIEYRIKKISYWHIFKNQAEVRKFLGTIGITKQ